MMRKVDGQDGRSAMSEFMFLYRSTQEGHREAMGSPERAQQSMKKWRAWFKEMSDKGQLKSTGQPLERVGKVVAGKSKGVTDGPYAETKDVIGGYSIVVAKDVEEATKLASGCPVLDYGGSVEVRPVMPFDV
jgi:hypothetical protein